MGKKAKWITKYILSTTWFNVCNYYYEWNENWDTAHWYHMSILVLHVPLWFYMCPFGSACAPVILHVPLWFYMCPFGSACAPVILHVPLWFYMSPCGSACAPIILHMPLWFYMCPFKWVKKIQIWQNGGQLLSNIADWCHILSSTCLKGVT